MPGRFSFYLVFCFLTHFYGTLTAMTADCLQQQTTLSSNRPVFIAPFLPALKICSLYNLYIFYCVQRSSITFNNSVAAEELHRLFFCVKISRVKAASSCSEGHRCCVHKRSLFLAHVSAVCPKISLHFSCLLFSFFSLFVLQKNLLRHQAKVGKAENMLCCIVCCRCKMRLYKYSTPETKYA